MIGGEVLTQLRYNVFRRLQTDQARRSGWEIMIRYWAVICRYTIQKFIKVIISKTIIFSRHIFGIIASMIYGSSRPRPRGESGVSSHRKYMIEKYMGKIWIKIQFHLTVSNTSEPESNAHICSQGAGCQVTSGLKSTWSLFPIIVKEIRTSDKEAETHIFRGLGVITPKLPDSG